MKWLYIAYNPRTRDRVYVLQVDDQVWLVRPPAKPHANN